LYKHNVYMCGTCEASECMFNDVMSNADS
jgi:hypothetical protein